MKAPEHDLNLEDVPQYFETHKIEATMAHLVELLLDKRPTNPRLFILQCAPGGENCENPIDKFFRACLARF